MTEKKTTSPDLATLTFTFCQITKVNFATENMEMLLFFKFWRLQDMSFATALNMIRNTQKHALKLIKKKKKEKKHYDLPEIVFNTPKNTLKFGFLRKKKEKIL